jgi:hypothetical protein
VPCLYSLHLLRPLRRYLLSFVLFVTFVCSLYGCLSSRYKSGHGNWLFARVAIFDTPRGDPGGESSKVNAQAGEGLTISSGRSIKRTLQPRDNTTHAQ